jgi:hypothetical protein
LYPRPFWAVPAGDHLASNRMPGTELVNVPFVAALFWLKPSVVPAALTAATLTAATVGFLFLAFRRLAAPRLAVICTLTAAFGTSLWTISSAEVWPHTVDALCLSLAMYALARNRPLWAGAALSVAITARPHMAVVALVLGLTLGWATRSWRAIVAVGGPATAGLAGVVLWNDLVFGHLSVSGGYPSYASDNLTGKTGNNIDGLLANVAGFFVSPQRGLFVFFPLAVLLVVGARAAWRHAAPWVRCMAVAGVAYSLVQLKINSFSGGDAFYGYRLATELVICTAPLAVVAVSSWVLQREWRWRLGRSLAAASVGLQAVGAFAFDIPQSSKGSTPWRRSPILDAVLARPLPAVALLLATIGVSVWLLQRAPSGLGSPAAADGRIALRIPVPRAEQTVPRLERLRP